MIPLIPSKGKAFRGRLVRQLTVNRAAMKKMRVRLRKGSKLTVTTTNPDGTVDTRTYRVKSSRTKYSKCGLMPEVTMVELDEVIP